MLDGRSPRRDRKRVAAALAFALPLSACLVVGPPKESGAFAGASGSSGGSSTGTGAGGSTGTISGGGASSTGGGATGAILLIAPDPVNFGYEPIESTVIACAEMSNPSTADFQVTGASFPGNPLQAFALSATDDSTPANPITLPIALPANGSAKVCFTFTPILAQAYSGEALLVTDDPGDLSPTIGLSGWGGGPQITCELLSIDFDCDAPFDGGIRGPAIVCTNSGSESRPFDAGCDIAVIRSPGIQVQVAATWTGPSESGSAASFRQTAKRPLSSSIPATQMPGPGKFPPCRAAADRCSAISKSHPRSWTSAEYRSATSRRRCRSPSRTTVPELPPRGTLPSPSESFRLVSTSLPSNPDSGTITIPGDGGALDVQVEFVPTSRRLWGVEFLSVLLLGSGE